MGDAADEAWDAAFHREADFVYFVRGIRDACHTKRCRIEPTNDNMDDDDWLPYRCATCGELFDFP